MDFDNSTSFEDIKISYYTAMVFNIVGIISIAYVITSLFLFAKRKKYLICAKGSRALIQRNANHRISILLTILLFLMAVCVLFYLIIDIPLYWDVSYPYCKMYFNLKVCFTGLFLMDVYFILWYRGFRAIHQEPLIQELVGRLERFLTIFTGIVIIILFLINFSVFFTSEAYAESNIGVGCRMVETKLGETILWSVMLASNIVCQSLLLVSLAHPLSKYKRKLHELGLQGNRVASVLKRSTAMAAVCILCNIMTTLFTVLTYQNYVFIRHVLLGSNLFLNYSAIVLSFSDWRSRFCPFSMERKKKTTSSISNTVCVTSKT